MKQTLLAIGVMVGLVLSAAPAVAHSETVSTSKHYEFAAHNGILLLTGSQEDPTGLLDEDGDGEFTYGGVSFNQDEIDKMHSGHGFDYTVTIDDDVGSNILGSTCTDTNDNGDCGIADEEPEDWFCGTSAPTRGPAADNDVADIAIFVGGPMNQVFSQVDPVFAGDPCAVTGIGGTSGDVILNAGV